MCKHLHFVVCVLPLLLAACELSGEQDADANDSSGDHQDGDLDDQDASNAVEGGTTTDDAAIGTDGDAATSTDADSETDADASDMDTGAAEPDAGPGTDAQPAAEGGVDSGPDAERPPSDGGDSADTGPVVCGNPCPAGTRLGGGPVDNDVRERFCRSTNDPLFDCGGITCLGAFTHSVSPSCNNGECGHGACDPGWGDCDGIDANGCESSLRSTSNCLTCGSSCEAGQACGAGGCGACNLPLQNCSGTCANLGSDAQHCGSCGKACQPGQTCQVGVCRGIATVPNRCGPDLYRWGPQATDCVNLMTDADNCGEYGNVCPTPGAGVRECVNGTCRGCGAGYLLINGVCRNPQSDRLACGGTPPGSGVGGPAGVECDGACVAGSCIAASATRVANASRTFSSIVPFEVDDTWIYSVVGTEIVRTPLGGGTEEPLVTSAITPADLAVDGTHLYWSDQLGHGIFRVPKGGGATEVVTAVTGTAELIAINSTTVFFIERNASNVFHSVPKSGGTSIDHDSTRGSVYVLEADDSYAAWSLFRDIHSYPRNVFIAAMNTVGINYNAGGPVYLGNPDVVLISSVVEQSSEEYWAAVAIVPRSEFPGPPTVIPPTSTIMLTKFGAPLLLSNTHVYSSGLRAPRCGGASEAFYNGAENGRLHVRGSYLYYGTTDGVSRRPL